ncbi:endonuclease/exonuclease/phosphatase family protein [Carboxylicivirga sp. A043]|uniref:endonuclease/exonuclease/phosphatase family protein n=1 Tax=Carboxylicivirga litoralis TaxID=2816963 RepID=UPI0021CAEE1B|nr:endonuclease/exonuclease/phosphatase family protein [Carboxylicivirga sp. A043]MCU4155864.1 endonuclease/exonuclease/phosphatase family protein [Carboxylicivirga sp. A043]
MKKHQVLLILFFLGVNLFAQKSINVATYNLRLKTESDGINQWQFRVDHLKSLIEYHEFDIFGTQEGFKEQLDDIAEIEGLNYFGKGRDDGKEAGEHAAIFYRSDKFKLLDSGNFWLSETPDVPSLGWDADYKRICTWGKFKSIKTKAKFYVFNVHFDHRGKIAQVESARLIFKKIGEIAGQSMVILCGDFNLEPDSEGIAIIKKEMIDSREVSSKAPYGPVGTFSGFNINSKLNRRIDYIFVSKGIAVRKYAALSDIKDNRFPSDHLPVVAKVEFDRK